MKRRGMTPTLERIFAIIDRDAPGVAHEAAVRAISDACDHVLADRNLPGDWYGEQIALEAVRLLKSRLDVPLAC